jgi:hypothetical protein
MAEEDRKASSFAVAVDGYFLHGHVDDDSVVVDLLGVVDGVNSYCCRCASSFAVTKVFSALVVEVVPGQIEDRWVSDVRPSHKQHSTWNFLGWTQSKNRSTDRSTSTNHQHTRHTSYNTIILSQLHFLSPMPRSGWNISMVTLNNVHNRHSISGRGHIASKLYFISCLCLVIFSKSLSSAFSGRFSPLGTDGFHAVQEQRALGARSTRVQEETHNDVLEISPIRREMICSAAGMLTAATIHQANTQPASAEIGTLPEFADTNAIVQGITVNVADESQKDTMIRFLENAFDFKTLRRRIRGTVDETWLGFGPEQVSIPETFQLPVSSFGEYGGHASINVRYDSSITTPFYRQGDDAPGTNIAYLQRKYFNWCDFDFKLCCCSCLVLVHLL